MSASLRTALHLAFDPKKGSPVIYANTILRTEQDQAAGEETDRAIRFLKAYTVFNVEQIDGLPARFLTPAGDAPANPDARIAEAEAFFAATGAHRPWREQRLLRPRSGPDHAPSLRSLPQRA